jgi:O-acetyl-ADP-ribose deacetylase (regulator of RNase III)
VAAPHYFQDALPHDALARAIRAVLDQARIQGIYRIAMPGLSIGIYRFPVEEAAMVTAQTLTGEAHRTRPSLIRLVFLDADITTHYEQAIKRVKGK